MQCNALLCCRLLERRIRPLAILLHNPSCFGVKEICTGHEFESKEGGKHRMSFRNFPTGDSDFFGGIYQKLVPGETLV